MLTCSSVLPQHFVPHLYKAVAPLDWTLFGDRDHILLDIIFPGSSMKPTQRDKIPSECGINSSLMTAQLRPPVSINIPCTMRSSPGKTYCDNVPAQAVRILLALITEAACGKKTMGPSEEATRFRVYKQEKLRDNVQTFGARSLF